MEWKLFQLLLVMIMLEKNIFLKIFKFRRSTNGTISYAKPKYTAKQDNRQFGICGSFKVNSITGENFFTFYGEDKEPWLDFSLWPGWNGESITAWLRINQIWRKVEDLDMFWLNFWIHLCLIVDLQSREITVALNGYEPVLITVEELIIQAPKIPEEALLIGKSYGIQFEGSVTNLFFLKQTSSLDLKILRGAVKLYINFVSV